MKPIVQDSLFDALARVEKHADPSWIETARSVVRTCARSMYELTTDDVWAKLDAIEGIATHERRALGPVVVAAIKAGLIEKTGVYVNSARADCHGRPIPVYRSLIFVRRTA